MVGQETVLKKPKLNQLWHRYWTLCKVSFQERMEYRWNTFYYMLMAVVPALVAIYLWGVVFSTGRSNESVSQITTYYLVASFIGWRIADFHWLIMWDIREGRLANYLLRPMSYPAATFWYEAGGRSWSTVQTLPIFVVMAILLGDNFKAPANPLNWLLTLIAFLVAWVLNFFITASLGLITIWQNQPEGFFALYSFGARCLGGVLVPISLMPGGFGEWLQWLPFAYIFSLPVRIFQGLPADKILQGFTVQAFWLLLSILFFRWVWRKAMFRHESYEGGGMR